MTVVYWRTYKLSHTSPIQHFGAYHNQHIPKWNRIQTVSLRKRPASVSEGFLFQAVRVLRSAGSDGAVGLLRSADGHCQAEVGSVMPWVASYSLTRRYSVLDLSNSSCKSVIFFLSDQRLHYSEKYYSCGKSAECYQHLSYLLCLDLYNFCYYICFVQWQVNTE